MPDDEIEALVDAYALKDERRTGWQLRGVDAPESVAAHSWGVALLCLAFEDRIERLGADVDRAVRLAVVHDLAEAETGDVPTRADPAAESPDPKAKRAREREALESIVAPFEPSRSLRACWEEYEARETVDARVVKDMDLVDMCLQALVYERGARYDPAEGTPEAFEAYDDLDEFFATAEPRLRTDLGRELVAEIRRRYEAAKTA